MILTLRHMQKDHHFYKDSIYCFTTSLWIFPSTCHNQLTSVISHKETLLRFTSLKTNRPIVSDLPAPSNVRRKLFKGIKLVRSVIWWYVWKILSLLWNISLSCFHKELRGGDPDSSTGFTHTCATYQGETGHQCAGCQNVPDTTTAITVGTSQWSSFITNDSPRTLKYWSCHDRNGLSWYPIQKLFHWYTDITINPWKV